jgi:hypothetical protein
MPEPITDGPGPAYAIPEWIGPDGPYVRIGDKFRELPPDSDVSPCDFQSLERKYAVVPYSIERKARPPLPTGDPHDQPYQFLGPTIVPRKISMASRPLSRYETMGPGPIYTKPPAIEERPVSIKGTVREKVSDTPAPTDYFKAPLLPAPVPLHGMLGPSTREPVDITRNSWKPSAAEYNCQPKFVVGRYGTSSFGGRKLPDYLPDTDGPVPPPLSTLGGPKFSIKANLYG